MFGSTLHTNKYKKNISYNNSPKQGHKHPYKNFFISDPFNNRAEIAKIAKGEKGVYLFEVKSKNLNTLSSNIVLPQLGLNSDSVDSSHWLEIKKEDIPTRAKNTSPAYATGLAFEDENTAGIKYVGSSINLYNRVCSYFMPSILAKSDRRVLRYFNKYGFNDVSLTLFIVNSDSSWDQVIELEQYLIDTLSPELNVDLVAGGYTGYHKPMSEEAKIMLRQLRGIPIYIYDTTAKSLIFISDSQQWIFDKLKIHHVSLNNSLSDGNLYLNRFFFSLDIISEFPFESVVSSSELISLVEKTKLEYKPNQPASKNILAENILHPELTKNFTSIGEVSRHLKGDRGTIRDYINGKSCGLYRGQWKFSVIEANKI